MCDVTVSTGTSDAAAEVFPPARPPGVYWLSRSHLLVEAARLEGEH
jgi:hypothetical protein